MVISQLYIIYIIIIIIKDSTMFIGDGCWFVLGEILTPLLNCSLRQSANLSVTSAKQTNKKQLQIKLRNFLTLCQTNEIKCEKQCKTKPHETSQRWQFQCLKQSSGTLYTHTYPKATFPGNIIWQLLLKNIFVHSCTAFKCSCLPSTTLTFDTKSKINNF